MAGGFEENFGNRLIPSWDRTSKNSAEENRLLPKSKRHPAEEKRRHFEKMIDKILYRRYQNLQSKLSGVWGIPG
jgi:hypothetical protein